MECSSIGIFCSDVWLQTNLWTYEFGIQISENQLANQIHIS